MLAQSVALYFIVGILLYAIGSLSPKAREGFREVRGAKSLFFVSLGMAVGVFLWPLVLVYFGVRISALKRFPLKRVEEKAYGPIVGGYATVVPMEVRPPQPRVLVGEIPCPTCELPARLYKGDWRSCGFLRMECDSGHWADIGIRSSYISEKLRNKILAEQDPDLPVL